MTAKLTKSRPLTQDRLDEAWQLHAYALKMIDQALGLRFGSTEYIIGTNFRELRERQTFEPLEDSGQRKERSRQRLKLINGGSK